VKTLEGAADAGWESPFPSSPSHDIKILIRIKKLSESNFPEGLDRKMRVCIPSSFHLKWGFQLCPRSSQPKSLRKQWIALHDQILLTPFSISLPPGSCSIICIPRHQASVSLTKSTNSNALIPKSLGIESSGSTSNTGLNGALIGILEYFEKTPPVLLF